MIVPSRNTAYGGEPVIIHEGATSLPSPPEPDAGVGHWNGGNGSVPAFELVIQADEDPTTLTEGKLYALTPGGVWLLVEELPASIALSPTLGYWKRLRHIPEVTHYGITGTLSAANAITATLRSVRSV